jgi:hypothetical protein
MSAEEDVGSCWDLCKSPDLPTVHSNHPNFCREPVFAQSAFLQMSLRTATRSSHDELPAPTRKSAIHSHRRRRPSMPSRLAAQTVRLALKKHRQAATFRAAPLMCRVKIAIFAVHIDLERAGGSGGLILRRGCLVDRGRLRPGQVWIHSPSRPSCGDLGQGENRSPKTTPGSPMTKQ